ncbi:glutamate receptor ionotropic, kainate glr-3-like [Periplaneta americana]|uniref:glutamate receptor ionotropic, kainate glr-3-like n=1 Tax=Periplaneta americana TaxID=6978 RepID=UPI0037E7C728
MVVFSNSNLFFFFLAVINIPLFTCKSVNNHKTQCLRRIAEQHFEQTSSFLVAKSNEDVYINSKENIFSEKSQSSDMSSCRNAESLTVILEDLFDTEKYSLAIWSNDGVHKKRITGSKYDGYVIVSHCQHYDDVVEGISNQVKEMRRYEDWNPRAKFIVILTEIWTDALEEYSTKKLSERILGVLWKWQVFNAITVVEADWQDSTNVQNTSVNSTPIFNVYTWFPYYPVGRCGDFVDAVLVDQWIGRPGDTDGYFLHSATLFPPKIPKNFQGCPLRISTFEYGPTVLEMKKNRDGSIYYDDGIDIKVMYELAKSANMTVVFRPPPPDNGLWGFDLGNGSWSGVPGEIMRGFSDLAVVGIWYKCDVINELDCLSPHIIDPVRWYVPCAKPYPRWMSITRVFKVSLWLGFLVSYIIVAFIMWIVVKISDMVLPESLQNRAYNGLVKCFINFWAIILEESASNNPPHIAPIRSVFLAWVIYCWAVNTVYQTFLTSFLIDPGLQHQISSEDELLVSGIGYGALSVTEEHLKFLGSKQRYPHRTNCPSLKDCLDSVAFKADYAFAFSAVCTDYQISVKYMEASGDPIICIFDEVICNQLITIPVMKGYPKKEHFNQVLRRVLEAGLTDKWFNDIKYMATLKLAKDFELPPGEYIKLSLKHLQSAFYFLIIGYICSICTFIVEFGYGRRQRRI